MKPLFFALLVLLLSCHDHPSSPAKGKSRASAPAIALLPFTGMDTNTVNQLKTGLEAKLNVNVIILGHEALPAASFYQPRQRYIADQLLVFLRQHKPPVCRKIIGVTASDISTRKEPYANWGVMGLGYCPGQACVISSFRAKRGVKDRQHFIKRMIILAMHELGHTFSLAHCKNTQCIMKDAEGKMNLDGGKDYCSSCTIVLRKAGILPPAERFPIVMHN